MNSEIETTDGQVRDFSDIPSLANTPWQMAYGERSAFEGLLAQIKPQLAIEIGTAEGGSLARIAAHSDEVHSFDMIQAAPEVQRLPNVHFHTGDNHVLLPELLAELAAAGRNVDFVLVDGDHSTEGVRQDMVDLLDSPAVRHTVIVMHDSMNEWVRTGLEQVPYDQYSKVKYVDLDFVAGFMFLEKSLEYELWGGLALVYVVADGRELALSPVQSRYRPTHDLVIAARDAMLRTGDGAPKLSANEHAEFDRLRERLDVIMNSKSWRLTEPLRRAKDLSRKDYAARR